MKNQTTAKAYIENDFKKHHRLRLYEKYANKIKISEKLNRSIVSNQANKNKPYHKWFKFKEAFSTYLVEYFLKQYYPHGVKTPELLDPFAGTGTALIVAAQNNWKAAGIELLPVGIASIKAKIKANKVDKESFKNNIIALEELDFEKSNIKTRFFNHINITRNAFPEKNEIAIANFNNYVNEIENLNLRYLFWFAGMSVLEDVSYTRKDGQYLRWDYRAGRNNNSKFNKGHILDFKLALLSKLNILYSDIFSETQKLKHSRISIKEGSCLAILPKLPDNKYNLVITSPPYCNRYDYTRTYALELAYMNLSEERVKNLRQTLLSSTVENKSKIGYLHHIYREPSQKDFLDRAIDAFKSQKAVQEVLELLYKARDDNKLNNKNIPFLVENYLFEMNLVIRELFRVLSPLGRVIMVNDNVQYNGEEVPIDLILSDFASKAGFNVDHIWMLKKGKGNSSQQMGRYGRTEIRKCVYVWTKPLSLIQ